MHKVVKLYGVASKVLLDYKNSSMFSIKPTFNRALKMAIREHEELTALLPHLESHVRAANYDIYYPELPEVSVKKIHSVLRVGGVHHTLYDSYKRELASNSKVRRKIDVSIVLTELLTEVFIMRQRANCLQSIIGQLELRKAV